MFFQVLCFCVFIAKNVNGLVSNEYQKDGIIDDNDLIKTHPHIVHCNDTYRIVTRDPLFLERHEVRGRGDCINYPYFCELMDNLDEKYYMSFEYLTNKLFRYYNILPKMFSGTSELTEYKVWEYIFPELRDGQIQSILTTVGDIEKLHVLFKILFPLWDRKELMQIFTNAKTMEDVLGNIIEELCPTFKTHVAMRDRPKGPMDPRILLYFMFPNVNLFKNWSDKTEFKFQKNFYNLLDLFFHNKLISDDPYPDLKGPTYELFRDKILSKYNIQNIPKEIQLYLFITLSMAEKPDYKSIEFVSKHYKPSKYDEPTKFLYTTGLYVNTDPRLKQVKIESKNYSEKLRSFCSSNNYKIGGSEDRIHEPRLVPL